MKGSRFSETQIIAILKEAESGNSGNSGDITLNSIFIFFLRARFLPL